jgi:ubiquinone/menaquinone biosynthesis C-methylase UbiE
MAEHVCPWWAGYLIDNPLRRLLHDPERIVGPYVRPGMTVLDLGCGMGMFSIAMARIVGPQGLVIAADLQQRMLNALVRRAKRAGLVDRIRTHRCEADRIGLDGPGTIDFALAFAMVHEVPGTAGFLAQVSELLDPGARFLVAEPRRHVPRATFAAMVELAGHVRLDPVEEPHVRWCQAVVLQKRA